MGWFQFNDVLPYREMRWRYFFDSEFPPQFFSYDAVTLMKWSKEVVGVMGMRSVVKAWTRGRVAGRGKREAQSFLGDLDGAFSCVEEGYGRGMVDDWGRVMKGLRRAIEKW